MSTRLEKAALRAWEKDRQEHHDRIAKHWRFTPEQRAEFDQIMRELDRLYDAIRGAHDRSTDGG